VSASSSVLVTGATGFLGRHLLRALRVAGKSCAVLVRDPESWSNQIWKGEAGPVSIIAGSPLEPNAWRKHPDLAGIRTIFHSAAMVQHSREGAGPMVDFNIGSTLHMVRTAQALGARLVFISTSGTVGCFHNPSSVADEDAPFAEALVGKWPYYASKIRAERESRALAAELGVPLVIVRPPVLLGPDDHRGRSTGHVSRILEHRLPAIPSGGMHFADVRDVATALARIVDLDAPRPVYHLPGTHCTLREFVERVSEVSGVTPVRLLLPGWAARGIARLAAGRKQRPPWLPDPVLLEMSTCFWGLSTLHARELNYTPRPDRQTLSDTIEALQAVPAPGH
jgi:dihydroflavonol-4-reductase